MWLKLLIPENSQCFELESFYPEEKINYQNSDNQLNF